jgi:hypothetical protein
VLRSAIRDVPQLLAILPRWDCREWLDVLRKFAASSSSSWRRCWDIAAPRGGRAQRRSCCWLRFATATKFAREHPVHGVERVLAMAIIATLANSAIFVALAFAMGRAIAWAIG